ncbi:MAG: hypothetical protein ACI4XH_03755 [Acutalibacteraceae bacterium]
MIRKNEAIKSMFIPPDRATFKLSLPAGFHFPPGCGYTDEEPYGFNVNVNHERIRPLFIEFKKFIGESSFPIDDDMRRLFEADIVINLFRKEYEASISYSSLEVNRYVSILIANAELADQWREHRERVFGRV